MPATRRSEPCAGTVVPQARVAGMGRSCEGDRSAHGATTDDRHARRCLAFPGCSTRPARVAGRTEHFEKTRIKLQRASQAGECLTTLQRAGRRHRDAIAQGGITVPDQFFHRLIAGDNPPNAREGGQIASLVDGPDPCREAPVRGFSQHRDRPADSLIRHHLPVPDGIDEAVMAMHLARIQQEELEKIRDSGLEHEALFAAHQAATVWFENPLAEANLPHTHRRNHYYALRQTSWTFDPARESVHARMPPSRRDNELLTSRSGANRARGVSIRTSLVPGPGIARWPGSGRTPMAT